MARNSRKEAKAGRLTLEQEEACRLRTLDSMSQDAVAKHLGRARDTVRKWEKSPQWLAYQEQLRADRHKVVTEAHHETITKGARLRVAVLEAAARALAQEAGQDSPDPDRLKKLGDLIDRLTTSAEDRGGYPKSERREHSGSVAVKRPEDMTFEELMDLLRQNEESGSPA